MLYSTPLWANPPPCHHLLKLVAFGPCPFSALRSGRASVYEIGREGMDGMACSVLCRSTPGLEAYPGVVGSPGAKPVINQYTLSRKLKPVDSYT